MPLAAQECLTDLWRLMIRGQDRHQRQLLPQTPLFLFRGQPELLIQWIIRLLTRGTNIVRALYGQRPTVKDQHARYIAFIPLRASTTRTPPMRTGIPTVIRLDLLGQTLQLRLSGTFIGFLFQPKDPFASTTPFLHRDF